MSICVKKNPQNSHSPIAIRKVVMLYLTKWRDCVMGDEIYTVAQTAQYLKVCDKTVRRLIASNKLVASRIGGRSLRIKKEDIDAYLAEHTNKEKGVAINE